MLNNYQPKYVSMTFQKKNVPGSFSLLDGAMSRSKLENARGVAAQG